ncbi:MAG: SCP2 sterol-binding domain-containing protein [Halapricum sp.]
MAITLPDEADTWVRTFRRLLNDNDAYAEAAAGWGVDFDGDFVLEILPDDVHDGDPLYFHLELRDGECLQASVLEDPNEVAHGYALRGDYADWKRLIQGELGIVTAVMNGTLDANGSTMRAMRYQDALVEMGETAARVDTEFRY